MATVSLKHVSKVYPDGTTAVDDFNLDIQDKEFIVFVGPSGCGKSTTLRMIAGLESITKGELFIDGTLSNDIQPKDRDIAMVFQNYALYPHMNVYENMAFSLKMKKYSKDEIKEKIDEAAKILNIEQLLDKKPRALSGGQRQRVALGRAIVRNPKVFLLDEPLSNLDAKLRSQMRVEISKLHKKLQTTFIYVTHDQTEAMTMADRIVIMKDGIVQQIDTPQNLYVAPQNKFVAGFIGTPCMNFFEGKVQHEGKNTNLIFGDHKLRVSQKLNDYNKDKVLFGIRAEHLLLAEQTADSISAKVSNIEILGAEVLLYLSIGDYNFIARADSSINVNIDDTLNVIFPEEKLYFFDVNTEQTIL